MIINNFLANNKTMFKLIPSNIPCIILSLFIIDYFSTTSSNNETDFQSLLALQKAIVSSDPHGALSSWNQSLPFCMWEGVRCGKMHKDRVVSIDLSSEGLTGSLSPFLGNISFLRSISLQNNSLSGPIPNEIGRLRRLQVIMFQTNSFTGQIPRNLSQCKNVYYLNLNTNNFTGTIIPELSSLLKLKYLYLSVNQFSGAIPPFIGNFTNLKRLYLANCRFEGEIPESFSQLHSLEFLHFAQNNLTGRIPNGMYNISSMSMIDLAFNHLEGTIASETGLSFPRLTAIYLNNNYFVGEIPASLSNSTLLEDITLSLNNFTGKVRIDFTRLLALTYLEVWGNNLDGNLDFISSMLNCTMLQVIDVSSNLLSGTLPNSITNLSSQLNFLSLNTNQLRGNIPSDISNLIGLTVMDISNNNLEGLIPPEIGKLNMLQQIYLGANRLTSEIPFSFGNLTLLNDLSLEINNLYGSIPQSLGNCTALLNLTLHYNNLSGPIPPAIMTISSISIMIDFSHNALTGTIPSEVGSLINLVELDLSHNRISGLIPNSLSKCALIDQIYLQSNLFSGQIPDALKSLRGVRYLDLSENQLSGVIPNFLGELQLIYLNLSFNTLEGQVPTLGVFQNESAVFLEGNNDLCGGVKFLKFPTCLSNNSKKNFLPKPQILIPVGVLATCIIFFTFYYYMFIWRKNKSRTVESFDSPNMVEFLRLSYGDILKATDGLAAKNLIGAGKFGSVYRGIINEGKIPVAVKVINLNSKGASRSFISECIALKGIRHRNLVKILSVCSGSDFQGNDFRALVYDLKANGNLDEWLHQDVDEENGERQNLRMGYRLRIAIDIASALEYLHWGTDSVIVHGDLKPSNILLDGNMTAHVGDFGLAKVFSDVFLTPESVSDGIKGTIGYIPPEYGTSGKISTEGDVYSYGILLLEILTGRRPTDGSFESHCTLRDFVRDALPGQVMNVLDPTIFEEQMCKTDTEFKNCITSLAEVALSCSMDIPRERMMMGDVVTELNKIIHAYGSM